MADRRQALDDDALMRRVIELSLIGVRAGHGGPFGCVVVSNGRIVAEAHNEVASSFDPTAHAEILAIRRASALLRRFDLSDCELYTNGAPCCMCTAAMLWGRLRRCHYILPLEASSAIGLGDGPFYDELARPLGERVIMPMHGHPKLAGEARAVYSEWHDMVGKMTF